MSNEARMKQGNFQLEARAKQEDFQIEARANHEKKINEPQVNNGERTIEQRTNRGKTIIEPRGNGKELSSEQLVARIKARVDTADNMLKLWQQNRRFITMIAKRYSAYAELDDLKQEGYLALYEAVNKYDSDKGVPFISYAAYWIRQYVTRYIQNCCQPVRIPVHTHETIQRYKKLVRQFCLLYGRDPTDREIGYNLEISQESVEQLKKDCLMKQIQSLDAPIEGTDALTVGDVVAAGNIPEEDLIKRMDSQAMKEKLWEAVDQLPGDQPEVIRRRYRDRLTLKETGRMMGVGIERARQIENKAMRTLRIPHRCRQFQGYYEEYLQAACYRHVGMREFNTTWLSEVEREALGY